MQKLKKYLLMLAIFGIAILAFSVMSQNALADTHTLSASGNANAGGTWNTGTVPSTGDNLVLTGAYNVAMNDAKIYGNITLSSYTGIATISTNIGYSSYYQTSGTWTGNILYLQNDTGNFCFTGGTLTAEKTRLIMSGANTFISGSTMVLQQLFINNSCTVIPMVTTSGNGNLINSGLDVKSGAVLKISNSINVRIYASTGHFVNYGSIIGAGFVELRLYSGDKQIALGIINNLKISDYEFGGVSASRTFKLLNSETVGNITVYSHGTGAYKVILDLNDKILTSSVTVSTRGSILSSVPTATIFGGLTSINGGLIDWTNIWLNPVAPTFTNSPSTTGTSNVFYSYTPTIDMPGTFTLISKAAWLNWYSGNSTLSGTASSGTFTISIKATSTNNTLSSYQNWTVTVASVDQQWAPTFTNSPGTTGTIGISYSYAPTCNETVTFSSVTKPAWASWTSNIMSGTPTAAGSYQFSINAVSTAGTLTAYVNWTVTVASVDQQWSPTFTNSPSTSGTLNDLYSYTPTINETGSFTLISKAAWLNWYSGNSTLSGTAGSGIFSCSIKATSTGGTLSSYMNWTVTVATVDQQWSPTITSTATIGLTGLVSYSYSFTTNDTSVVTLIGGPSWLSLSNNGTSATPHNLSGTPAALGTYTVKIQAQDVAGTLYAYQNFTITVSGYGPGFTSTPNTALSGLSAYSYTVTLNVTSTVTATALPSWATLSNNGTSTAPFIITGTPAAQGTYTVKIKALASVGDLYSWQNFTITVSGYGPAFTSTPKTALSGLVAYSYTVTLNVTSTVTIINLPSWATMSNNGTSTAPFIISGTPTALGTFSVNLRALSTIDGTSSWQNFTITVSGWGPAFTNSPVLTSMVNVAYSYAPTANESVTFTLILKPSWANWSGNNMSGMTIQGSFSFSIKATSTIGALSTYMNWTLTMMSGSWSMVHGIENGAAFNNDSLFFYTYLTASKYYSVTLTLANNDGANWSDVTWFIGFPEGKTIDYNSVRIKDLNNNVVMMLGLNYDMTLTGVRMTWDHFNTNLSRSFLITIYDANASLNLGVPIAYTDSYVPVQYAGENYYEATASWTNGYSAAYTGSIQIKIDSDDMKYIILSSVIVFDHARNRNLTADEFTVSGGLITVTGASVPIGGVVSYDVYFLLDLASSTQNNISLWDNIPGSPIPIWAAIMALGAFLAFVIVLGPRNRTWKRYRIMSLIMLAVLASITVLLYYFNSIGVM